MCHTGESIMTQQYKRITRKQAKQLLFENKTIYLIACNLRPGSPYNFEYPMTLTDDLINDAKRYKHYDDEKNNNYYARQYSDLWKGSIEATVWDLMYSNWSYYNTNSECGYYAHYYILE